MTQATNLEGTEKQIKLAEDIRAGYIEFLRKRFGNPDAVESEKGQVMATQKTSTEKDMPQEKGRYRIMLSKLVGEEQWHITSNPRWDHFSKAQNNILQNFCNKYAEYENCGVRHRLVRLEDSGDYGIDKNDVKKEWVLDVMDLYEQKDKIFQ